MSHRASISRLSSGPLDFNPQWMVLDLSHQQDLTLLLFGDLEGVGTGDALAFRMDRQGQGQSIESRYMKYGLQDKFDKIHGRVIVVIEDNVPHTRTLCFYHIIFEEIESRFPDGSNSVWILLL